MESQNKTYISFYLKDGAIRVYTEAIRFLGQPNYVRFLLNGDGSSMVMEPYHKKEFQSIRVRKNADRKLKKMHFSSAYLCRLMTFALGWNPEKSYRVPGRYIPAQKIVVFDMTKATIINSTNYTEEV